MLWQLIAQATPSAIPEVGPWAQTGLLGLLTAILLYMFPRYTAEQKAERIMLYEQMTKDRMLAMAENKADRDADRGATQGLMTSYQEETKYERAQCERHFTMLSDLLGKSHDTLGTAIGGIEKGLDSLDTSHRSLTEAIHKLKDVENKK